jgi:hypothetical protein
MRRNSVYIKEIYKSYIKYIEEYFVKNKLNGTICIEEDQQIIINFSDYLVPFQIMIETNCSPNEINDMVDYLNGWYSGFKIKSEMMLNGYCLSLKEVKGY